jgi:lecithin-cholesterol acyltransferase
MMRQNRALLVAIVILITGMLVGAMPGKDAVITVTPVVLFPGWATTKLEVQVDGQTAFPECPETVTFEWAAGITYPPEFSQVCVDKFMTLVVDPDRKKSMPERISNQQGVTVSIKDYSTTQSLSPYEIYEPMFIALEGVGYEQNVSIRVAGYDSRLSPDLGGFLERSIALIEETY